MNRAKKSLDVDLKFHFLSFASAYLSGDTTESSSDAPNEGHYDRGRDSRVISLTFESVYCIRGSLVLSKQTELFSWDSAVVKSKTKRGIRVLFGSFGYRFLRVTSTFASLVQITRLCAKSTRKPIINDGGKLNDDLDYTASKTARIEMIGLELICPSARCKRCYLRN